MHEPGSQSDQPVCALALVGRFKEATELQTMVVKEKPDIGDYRGRLQMMKKNQNCLGET